MNHGSEDIQRRILMLLRDFPCTASLADVDPDWRSLGCAAIASSFQTLLELLSPRLMNSSSSDSSEPNFSFSQETSFELGDIPVVQERFQALLKHRLQSEIQKNPPLFPWETELLDYEEADTEPAIAPGGLAGVPVAAGSRPGWGWLEHVKHLKLPVPANIPEPVLATLLQRCQDAVQSSLQEGAKLVRAVEDLFPGQTEALNYLAGNVIMAPARSPQATTTEPPLQYDAVTPDQQMVLSLLAARELINVLSFRLSASEPRIERQWQTEAGVLMLQAEYGPGADSCVRVQAQLPVGGSVTVRHHEMQTMAQRAATGRIGLELLDPQPGMNYTVDVRLAGIDSPLTFALRLEA